MSKSKFLATATSLTLMGAALISIEGFGRVGEAGRHGHSGDVRATLLQRLDSNADGVLSLEEFSERNSQSAQRQFHRKDTDSDALLSLQELSATRSRRRHPNLDGLDLDALGLCVAEALGYELPEPPDSATTFAAADTNSDQSVDLDEFLAAGNLRAEERFAQVDGDGDGQLSSDEIDAYQAVRQEQRDAHHTCVSDQLDEENLLN